MITLNTIFQDGAVLQRRKPIPVWGNTAPDVTVKAVFAGNEAFCRSSATGDFLVYLPPMEAGGPFELQISTADGSESVTVRDILVGEVWLASGQSNMEYPLGRGQEWERCGKDEPDSIGKMQKREFDSLVSDPDKMRYFTVARCASSAREKDTPGAVWRKMTAADSGNSSAVAAWYGYFLQQKLDVPVGLIISSWGGTVAEAWTGIEALLGNPDTAKSAMERLLSHKSDKNYLSADRPKISLENCPEVKPDPGISDFAADWAKPDFDDSAWKDMEIPGSWIKFGISGNGAVWVRKTVEIPADWVGEELLLHTGGIDKHDISFANGTEIGRTGTRFEDMYYNTDRDYPIPAKLVTGNKVTIAVRGFSYMQDGSFMGKWYLIRVSDGAKLPLNGVWKIKAEIDWGCVSPRPNADGMGMGNQHTPGILFDGMIRPLIPYALRGVIWYQGESNAVRAAEYYGVMKTLVRDWSYHFHDQEMPFLTVQLAGYGYRLPFAADNSWAFVREAQRLLARDEKNVFMATAVDAGEVLDIHPQDKKTVGWRLAQCALNEVYGDSSTVPYGPEIVKAVATGCGQVELQFKYAENMTLDGSKEQSFYVTGDGKNFFPADTAAVDGDKVILVCSAVKTITEVRYAWSPFPSCPLSNGAGITAASFKITVD